MSLKQFVRLTIVAFGIFGAALAIGTAVPAAAEPFYPWCSVGSAFHCYYMTREQCEEAVDYHGFCVTDPNVPRRYDNATRNNKSAPIR